MRVAVTVSSLLALVAIQADAEAKPDCSRPCVERVKKRFIRVQQRAEWRSYKNAPMPYCTWGPESGPPRPGYGQWAHRRYRVPNQAGGDGGGKFQIMLKTWFAFGGGSYASNPIYARRLHQERVARRIAFAGTAVHGPQGLGAWVNCR